MYYIPFESNLDKRQGIKNGIRSKKKTRTSEVDTHARYSHDNVYYNRRWRRSFSEKSAVYLKENERQERSKFVSLVNVSPKTGWGGRVDLNVMALSKGKFSLLVDNTNVVSGPVIPSALI